ncbi:hypothetical protein [Gordonia sihwensis]|uniref:hypothetical protein n=1 Tax=Gordonia sihwensis TaxID=173559 RepID=UPI0005F0C0E3|nr:hypothetical protein [Gordonia sihwensis]KJR07352.1 pyrrolo-quinoline quinone beta-propeller repeat-containing protein [Gordonia sihwensis]
MSTDGRPDDPARNDPAQTARDVDHYAETMSRPVPDPPSVPPLREPTRTYDALGPEDPYRSGPHYAPTGYPTGPYPPLGYGPAPAPAGGAGRAVLLGVAIACVIALAVAAVVVWMKVVNAPDETTAQPAPAVVTQAPPTHTVTSVVADPETDAAGRLRDQASVDAAAFRAALADRWAAQISAKRPGLYADGRTWDNQTILAEFESSRSRYPQVRLLDSSEWPVFSESGWWVTVSAQGFASADDALAWCRGNGLDKDHCFAKLISSSRGPEGSTLYQK